MSRFPCCSESTSDTASFHAVYPMELGGAGHCHYQRRPEPTLLAAASTQPGVAIRLMPRAGPGPPLVSASRLRLRLRLRLIGNLKTVTGAIVMINYPPPRAAAAATAIGNFT